MAGRTLRAVADAAPTAGPTCASQEKRLALETLRAHKDGAHKLRMDLADAERAHDATLKQMQELEHEIVQRQQRVDALNGTLNKIGGATQNTRVMEARRETLVAEVARRQEALQQHIDAPLEKLLEMQRKFDTSVAGKKNEQRAAERAFSDARIANEHVKDAVTRENNNQARGERRRACASAAADAHLPRARRSAWRRRRRCRQRASRSARRWWRTLRSATRTWACSSRGCPPRRRWRSSASRCCGARAACCV